MRHAGQHGQGLFGLVDHAEIRVGQRADQGGEEVKEEVAEAPAEAEQVAASADEE